MVAADAPTRVTLHKTFQSVPCSGKGADKPQETLAGAGNCASRARVTPFPWTDLIIIAGLIVLNGVFAMSELAIVSARTATLRSAAQQGNGGARIALELAAEPGKFLSTVQIGITLIGIIAGAYSGASLGGPVGERLAALGVPHIGPRKPVLPR